MREAKIARSFLARLQLMKRLGTRKRKPESSILVALAERLHKALDGRDVGELAAKVGVTPVTLYRWLGAKFDPGIAKLSRLAEVLDVSLAWLITGQGPMNRRRAIRHARLADYDLPEYATLQGSSDQPPIAFLESWLSRFLYGPNESAFVTGDTKTPLLICVPDDSMEPTIKRGALVLIDRSFGMSPSTRAQAGAGSVHDGIYVFPPSPSPKGSDNASAQFVIRRVLYMLNGKMIVRCDNPKYPEEIYSRDARSRPTPIGRAVWQADRI
jgi:transcriptional regulator with XRE-family HTH domain